MGKTKKDHPDSKKERSKKNNFKEVSKEELGKRRSKAYKYFNFDEDE